MLIGGDIGKALAEQTEALNKTSLHDCTAEEIDPSKCTIDRRFGVGVDENGYLVVEAEDDRYLVFVPDGVEARYVPGPVYLWNETSHIRKMEDNRTGEDVAARALFLSRNTLRFGENLKLIAHPNIVGLRGFALLVEPEREDQLYIIMDWIEGPTLPDWIQEDEERSVNLLVGIIEQLGSAISHINSCGFVFPDFGIEDVLVTDDDQAIIVDIEYLVRMDARGIAEGFYFHDSGTGSPEECARKELTVRANVYNLAVFAFYLLTYESHPRDPMDFKTWNSYMLTYELDLFRDGTHEQVPFSSNVRNQLSNEAQHRLTEVLRKALSEKPEDRYSNVPDFVAALKSCLE